MPKGKRKNVVPKYLLDCEACPDVQGCIKSGKCSKDRMQDAAKELAKTLYRLTNSMPHDLELIEHNDIACKWDHLKEYFHGITHDLLDRGHVASGGYTIELDTKPPCSIILVAAVIPQHCAQDVLDAAYDKLSEKMREHLGPSRQQKEGTIQ